jgi:hypothetical protein
MAFEGDVVSTVCEKALIRNSRIKYCGFNETKDIPKYEFLDSHDAQV